jgi:Domain of unknown function (DUF4167)
MNSNNRNGNYRPQRPRPAGDRRHKGQGPNFRPRQGAGQGPRHNGSSGNAQRNYERYIALAREAALSGDSVEMENCYQHAEHYFRVMKERDA